MLAHPTRGRGVMPGAISSQPPEAKAEAISPVISLHSDSLAVQISSLQLHLDLPSTT